MNRPRASDAPAIDFDCRDQFELPQGKYLLNHSVGCLPRAARAAMEEKGFEVWAQMGEGWSRWIDDIAGFNAVVARLLNCDASRVCPQVNLSSALSKILQSLALNPAKPVILLSEEDWPSLAFVFQQAQRDGYQLRYLPRGADLQDLDVWDEALSTDVAMVLLTHVQSMNGRRLPIEEISKLSAARSIVSIADVAQSVGAVPVDLARWQTDFVLGSCVKWLCGGPGAGFLVASEQMCASAEPADVGWFSHANPFEFDIHHFQYAPDARRFWGGTPSVWPYLIASASIETLLAIGTANIYARRVALSEQLAAGLPEEWLVSPVDPELRGGTLIVDCPDNDAAFARLRSAGVHCDQRKPGLRLSPHIYNTASDIEAAIDCLAG